MSQASTYNHNHQVLPEGYHMRKSDIVIAIIALRTGVAPSQKQILKDLSLELKYRSWSLEIWDQHVDPNLTPRIIKHVGSAKGELTMQALVGDIDIMVGR